MLRNSKTLILYPIDNENRTALKSRLQCIIVHQHTFKCKIPSTFVVQQFVRYYFKKSMFMFSINNHDRDIAMNDHSTYGRIRSEFHPIAAKLYLIKKPLLLFENFSG